MAALNFQEASEVLSDETKAAIIHRGRPYVDHMFRNITPDEECRIRSGDLTRDERAEKDGFAVTRHAAVVFADQTL